MVRWLIAHSASRQTGEFAYTQAEARSASSKLGSFRAVAVAKAVAGVEGRVVVAEHWQCVAVLQMVCRA